jgi:hypothetical protein
VHVVLGNHEVMVMTGDLRYGSKAEFAAFAPDETQAECEAFYADYRRLNTGGEETTVRQTFEQQYPRVMSRLGNLILSRPIPVTARIGSMPCKMCWRRKSTSSSVKTVQTGIEPCIVPPLRRVI